MKAKSSGHRLKSLKEHVDIAAHRRLINSEYRRGFMEGQHASILVMAECIDGLSADFDHVAFGGRFVQTEEDFKD